jgi:phosphohistidine phosphatase
MATIFLLRHAKSRWDEGDIVDHDRGLAPRGLRDAPAMGAHARTMNWIPHLVLCSTAKRAVDTAAAYLAAAGAAPAMHHLRSIYLAPPAHLLDLIRREQAESVLLVGHDPGIHELARLLASGRTSGPLQAKFPTGALAVLDLPGSLAEAQPGGAVLRAFVRPKDLPAPTSGQRRSS